MPSLRLLTIFAQGTAVAGQSWSSISFAILLVALLLSAYILFRRYQSRRLLMQRIAELEALGTVGRTIVTAELNVNALCELIAHESGQIIDNRTFQVGIFEDQLYRILFWTIDGERQLGQPAFDLSEDSGVIGWVRETRQPLLVNDFQREMNTLPARPRYISNTPPRAAIFVPMISGEDVIGVIAAQSKRPYRFNDEDMRRLTIIANQAAAAISRARLYERERQRARHLELIVNIAQEVNAINDLDKIFSLLVQRVRDTFGFHPVSIFGIDPSSGAAFVAASSLPALAQKAVRIPPEQGLVGTAVVRRQMIIANNTDTDPHYANQIGQLPETLTKQTRAEVAIPLIVDNELLGVLDVQSRRANVFGPGEKTILEALSATVAAAIHKARQFAQQEEQAWLSTVQYQLATVIGRSDELGETAAAVTALLRLLLGAELCAILLRDDDGRPYYQCTAVAGLSPQQANHFCQRRLAIGDWSTLDAVHIGQLPLTTRRRPRWLHTKQATDSHPLHLWPLATKRNQLGVLLLQFDARQFSDTPGGKRRALSHRELQANLVDQLSKAIETNILRLALQEEGWVNTALLQVAGAVNSLIDLEEILNTIVRLVPMLVGVGSAVILVYHEEEELFHLGSSYGISSMGRGLLDTLQIQANEMPLTTNNDDLPLSAITVYASKTPPWLERIMGTATAYALPLNVGGRLVGAMLVGMHASHGRATLSARRSSILRGIAQQAAIAVVNNRLYGEAAERTRLTQELGVAHGIQSSLLPEQAPRIPGFSTANYWLAARQVSGDFYDFMDLGNGRWGFIIADVADKGIPAALFMALCRTILRTVAFSRHNPADVLMRANEIIDTDTQTDLFITACYAIWDNHNQTLVYANAGHNPPLLLRANGKARLLPGNGMALGVLPQVTISSRTVRLRPGDTLLLYTDGVTEAINEDYDEFGLARLQLAAKTAHKRPAADILEAIIHALNHHAGGATQFDDITLVVLKRDGAASAVEAVSNQPTQHRKTK